MIALLVAAAMLADDSTAFADSMVGLWNIGSTVLVITSSNRANCFDANSRTLFQWRDGYVTPEGKPTGAIIGRPCAFLFVEAGETRLKVDADSLSGSFQKYGATNDGTNTTYKPKNASGPDPLQIFQIDYEGWDGRYFLRSFKYTVYDAIQRAADLSGTATRCGKISDISVSGAYHFQGKTLVLKVVPADTTANPQPLTGEMDWGGQVLDIKGFRDYTHLWWKATLRQTGEPRAEGYGEWAPTPAMVPGDMDGKWKPADRLYVQCYGPAFESRVQKFMMDREGD